MNNIIQKKLVIATISGCLTMMVGVAQAAPLVVFSNGGIADADDVNANFNELGTRIETISLTPGPVGAAGSQGPVGPQGLQGLQGFQGAAGVAGAVGAQGPAGADSTVAGPTGPAGTDGATGLTGAQGPAGADGAEGLSGIDGLNGLDAPDRQADRCWIFQAIKGAGLLNAVLVPPYCSHALTNTVFITSTSFGANLGGLDGADRLCQSRADAVSLPGTYRAWLADTTGAPESRFTRSINPYVLTNGTQIAVNYDAFASDIHEAPMAVTESGIFIDPAEGQFSATAWSGAETDGTRFLSNTIFIGHCQNWTSTDLDETGSLSVDAHRSDQYWSANQGSNCGQQRRLLCVEQ